jgi:hypothetical protein
MRIEYEAKCKNMKKNFKEWVWRLAWQPNSTVEFATETLSNRKGWTFHFQIANN